MKIIYKYEIPPNLNFELKLPGGAQLLDVGVQNNIPVLWALIDKENEIETRKFYIALTGWDIEEENHMKHIGTFQIRDGKYVGHVFEIIEYIQ